MLCSTWNPDDLTNSRPYVSKRAGRGSPKMAGDSNLHNQLEGIGPTLFRHPQDVDVTSAADPKLCPVKLALFSCIDMKIGYDHLTRRFDVNSCPFIKTCRIIGMYILFLPSILQETRMI